MKKSPKFTKAQQRFVNDLVDVKVKNGLMGALGFPGSGGMGWPGNPWSEQLSDPATIFKNLRWFLVSNYRQVLSEAYVELGLVQKLVNMPVDDALRGGITIKSGQLDEDELRKLQVSIDRNGDIRTAGFAEKWNRLFGGAGILVMTDQDPQSELDIKSITADSELEFHAVDMWELFWTEQNVPKYAPGDTYGDEVAAFDYYGQPVDKSRVFKMKGLEAPSFIRPRLRGWGFSVVEILVRSINQYLKASDLSFEVLDEFKVDVYRVKNLVNTLLSPQGNQLVQQRFQQANYIKNYQNAIVMDSEDEYQQKQLSFTGLAEAMEGIRIQVASEMNMPMIKLFGTPASGMNADDESSLEVYNNMVESEVREKMKWPIMQMIEIRAQQLFGDVPDDLEFEYKPLRELSAIDTEAVKTQVFARAFQAKQGGELSTFEFREICNKANLFPIRLDTASDELNPDDPEIEEMVTEGTNQPDEETEPGAEGQAAEKKSPKKNSLEFDRASYEADGGDATLGDPRRAEFYKDPYGVDKAKWSAAKQKSIDIYGTENVGFTVWAYKKSGGKFQ